MVLYDSTVPGEERSHGAGKPSPSKDTFQDLVTRIIDVCSGIHGGDFLLANLIQRIERFNPWTSAMSSSAHWLAWCCGFDMVTARERVRATRALGASARETMLTRP